MKHVATNRFLNLFPGPIKTRPDSYRLSLAILCDCNFIRCSCCSLVSSKFMSKSRLKVSLTVAYLIFMKNLFKADLWTWRSGLKPWAWYTSTLQDWASWLDDRGTVLAESFTFLTECVPPDNRRNSGVTRRKFWLWRHSDTKLYDNKETLYHGNPQWFKDTVKPEVLCMVETNKTGIYTWSDLISASSNKLQRNN